MAKKTALEKEISQLRAELDTLKATRSAISEPVKISQSPPLILTKTGNYEVWKRIITSEIRVMKCEDLINQNLAQPKLSEEELERRRSQVYTHIMSRLHEDYQKLVCAIENPAEMLLRIERIKRPKMPSTRFAVKRGWSSLTFSKSRENAEEFITRFEEQTRKVESFGEAVAETDIKENFLIATQNSFPELVRKYDAANGKMSIDELKTLLLNEEAMENEAKDRAGEGEAHVAEPQRGRGRGRGRMNQRQRGRGGRKRSITCHWCGKPNHVAAKCYSKAHICYNCKQSTTNPEHFGDTCRNPKVYGANFPSSRGRGSSLKRSFSESRTGQNMKQNDEYRGTSRGTFQGRGRGQFRGVNRLRYQRGNKTWYNPSYKHEARRYDEEPLYKKVRLADKKDSSDKYAFVAVDRERSNDETMLADYDDEINTVGAEKGNKNFTSIDFVADCAATETLVNKPQYLSTCEKVIGRRIRSANKNSKADLNVEYEGTMKMRGKGGKILKLKKVLCAKSVARNLLSIRKLVNEGAQVLLDDTGIQILNKRTKEIMKEGTYDGKFWWLNFNLIGNNNFNKNNRASANAAYTVTKEGKAIDSKGVKKKTIRDNEGSSMKSQKEGSKIKKNYIDREHSYSTRQGKNDDDTVITYETINNSDTLEKYINTVCNIKLNDLRELDENKVLSLKENIGLIWHYRLAHASKGYLEAAAKIIPELRGVKFDASITDCEICKRAKMRRVPSKTVRYRFKVPLQLLSTDVMGPISPGTYKFGARYIVTFIDDTTRYAWAYPMVDKTMVHIAFGKMLDDARKIRGKGATVSILRLDGGTEYKTESFKRMMEKEKIERDVAPTKTPNLNSTAERFNLELQQKIRCLLFSSGFPLQMWAYALQFAVYVYNRTPHKSINMKIPYELLHERPCTVNYMKRFGCLCFALNQSAKGKWEERGIAGFLVGCDDTCYRIIDPSTGKVYRTKHVDAIESKTYGDVYRTKRNLTILKDPPISKNDEGYDWFLTDEDENVEGTLGNGQQGNTMFEAREAFSLLCEKYTKNSNDENDETEMYMTTTVTEDEPLNYGEAVNSENREEWLKAIKQEFDAHVENNTWAIVERNAVPSDQPILTSRWLFKRKDAKNSVGIFKARLVIRGYADKNMYSRMEIYAPVARLTDIRFMLAVANKFSLTLYCMDVSTAFLNGRLDKKVYMEIPEGHKDVGRAKTHVCEVKRALYGLKCSARKWFERFREAMVKLNFEVYPFQACIFKWRKGQHFVILLLYVDDCLLLGNHEHKLKEVKDKLSKEFKMKDFGEPTKFVGIEIVRDMRNNVMYLHQRTLIKKILKRFNMEESRPVKTPGITNEGEGKRSNKTNSEILLENQKHIPYREAIGSLLYLASGTRPDLSYVVNTLSRKQNNYTNADWVKVKRVLRYLRGTENLGLKYTGKGNQLECYADASLGTNDEKGKSTSGLIVKLFDDIIYWRTKKQTHVALSSAESEYLAMSLACKELVCIREMCIRLLKMNIVPILYEDNKAAIKIATSDESQTLKHIVKLCYHYVRLEVSKGNVIIKWVRTDEQLADGFTKALGIAKFKEFQKNILCGIDN